MSKLPNKSLLSISLNGITRTLPVCSLFQLSTLPIHSFGTSFLRNPILWMKYLYTFSMENTKYLIVSEDGGFGSSESSAKILYLDNK